MLLGEILIRKKLITAGQLKYSITKQKGNQQKLGTILLDLGIITDNELDESLSEQYWRRNGYWVIEAIDRPIDR